VALGTNLGGALLDWMMRQMDDLRPEVLAGARGEVLEVGFGTGLNLPAYPAGVTRVVGLDPNPREGLAALEERVRAAPFAVDRCALRADGPWEFPPGTTFLQTLYFEPPGEPRVYMEPRIMVRGADALAPCPRRSNANSS